MQINKKTVVIVGGGPAGMFTALFLSEKYKVLLFDKEKTVGRKFLVAGKGGFNLSNNAENKELIKAYSPQGFLEVALENFGSNELRVVLKKLGLETYVGTSNRVFPVEGIKPAEVLKSIVSRLEDKGVEIYLNHKFTKFIDNQSIEFVNGNKIKQIRYDYCVLALGGASWSKTGSDGKWQKILLNNHIKIEPFQSSNCGVNINWEKDFIKHHEGKPLKNIAVRVSEKIVKGEVLVTKYGLEGNAIYPVVKNVRSLLNSKSEALLCLDLKPNNSIKQLLAKIEFVQSNNFAKKLKIDAVTKSLLKNYLTKEEYLSKVELVNKIKHFPLFVSSLRPIEEAISTVGGVDVKELNANFELEKIPNVFTIGEMVDWDAPTGGFLLQGCFSMAYRVATRLNKELY